MIDTGETVALATTTLHENGAAAIFVLVSHALIQPNSLALTKLAQLPIARLVVTNTLPQNHLLETVSSMEERNATPQPDHPTVNGTAEKPHLNGFKKLNGVAAKVTVLDVSPLLAESIRRTHNGESISLLFGDWAERAGMAGAYASSSVPATPH